MIASHGVTEERAKAVTFANPHYCSGGMIVAMDAKIRTAGPDWQGGSANRHQRPHERAKLAGVKEGRTSPRHRRPARPDLQARGRLGERQVRGPLQERGKTSSWATCCSSSALPPPWPKGNTSLTGSFRTRLRRSVGRWQVRRRVQEVLQRRRALQLICKHKGLPDEGLAWCNTLPFHWQNPRCGANPCAPFVFAGTLWHLRCAEPAAELIQN